MFDGYLSRSLKNLETQYEQKRMFLQESSSIFLPTLFEDFAKECVDMGLLKKLQFAEGDYYTHYELQKF